MPERNDSLSQPARLAAIAASDLLDTGAIPALDRVVRSAARLLGAPVAQLNVVTADRQVPVSHSGGDGWGRAVGLERSFCKHVIRSGEPLAVKDARVHPQVADSPATREGGIVAYLSIPIISPRARHPLATLCVVDFEPRAWSEQDVATLSDLAAWALSEIELRAGQRRDRIRTDAALRESEERYRTLFESIDEGFCVIEVIFECDRATDYRFLEVNPAFVQQTGLEQALGRRIRELAPTHEQHWFERYGHVARTGDSLRFQADARALGRFFDVFAFPVGAPEEQKVAVLFRDISELRAAASERERLVSALELERARLTEVIRRAPAFIAVLRGPEHVLEIANDAYLQLIGHRDVTGRPLFESLPDARGQGYEEILDRVLATGEPYIGRGVKLELRRTPDAPIEQRVLDLTYVPLTEVDGTRSGIVALGMDVTGQVRAREQIERARDRAERLQALTAALAQARTVDEVADVVVAEMVVALGARTGALAGRAPDSDAMLLLRTIGFPDDVVAGVRRQQPDLRSPLTECFRTQQPVWIERRDGPQGLDQRYPPIAPVWDALDVQSAAFVPLITAGETVGVISFAFEHPRTFEPEEQSFLLTLGQQAALALERARLFNAEHAARAEAERANLAKSEFLAVMSHELRTPLNAIAGYVELLEMEIRGPITPLQRADLQRVQVSQRHLMGLINEVLNFAKLETGAVDFQLDDVPLQEVLAAAEALLAPQAAARGLSLTLLPCPPTLMVRADAEKLRQVLVNLLANAVKFTEPGGRVEIECLEADEQVHVEVRDTGIGILPDQLERIFEPFVQVRGGLTRTTEGAGLGLAISRDLARGMGGDLVAESTPGVGSTFTIRLVRAQPQSSRQAAG